MGLLDALNSDEARLGLGLLAAGGYSPTPMSFGQRIQSAMQGQDAQKRGALQNKLLQSQVDENASQAQLRQQQIALAQRKQELDAQFMGSGLLGAAPGAAPAMPGAAAPGGQPAPAGGFTAQQISQQFGIPYEAVVADYKFNGGKKIAELISDRTKPNWQNVNGNLVNTSAPGFAGGMQGGMASSADGKVTAWQPDGQGGLVVGAPKGALNTFRAYQGASADFKPIKVFNPVTQREEFTSEAAVVGARPGGPSPMAGPGGNVQSPAYSGGSRDGANAESIRMIQSELQNPRLGPQDRAALTREIARLQQQSPGIGMAAGPSADEAAANKAAETRAVNTAAADVVRDTTGAKDKATAAKFLNITKQVEDVFTMGPTDSGVGSLVDSGAAFFGKSTKGAEAAQRLKALGGWLVANVPRMEGPQSNFDVANYQVQAADVANDKLPLDRRKAALDSIKTMMQGVAGKGAEGGWEDKPKPQVMDALPKANASNKGMKLRDTTTGKTLVSNGMQWKEE